MERDMNKWMQEIKTTDQILEPYGKRRRKNFYEFT